MSIALDATYSLGRNLSGVGVYSREILFGLARAHAEERFRFYYRPHRFLRSFGEPLPANASRRVLRGSPRARLFHALNQRVDFPPGGAGTGSARRVVATFHDLFVISGEYSSPEFRARFTDQARQAAERSDLIIAVSAFTARQVEELLGVEPARIRVVRHGVHFPGVHVPRVHVAASDSAAAGGDRSREKLVLSVGAIQKRKNIARLVKAFERMPAGWRLALAGSVEGYGAAEELRAVEESPRRSDIDVLGYVTAAERERLYQRASIFAFPSLDEGFGMPVLEAMAHGVPVVASRRSAIPEVAGEAALLVDPENVEELGEALSRLAAGEPVRRELAERGRARALLFPWEAAVERTWEVYRELL